VELEVSRTMASHTMGLVEWVLVSLFVGGLLIGLGAWLVLFVESIRAVLCLTPDAR